MNTLFIFIRRVALIALLMLLIKQYSFAQVHTQVLCFTQQQFQKDSSIEITDMFTDTAYQAKIDTPYNVKNIVTLKIDESSKLFLKDSFTVTVQVRISYFTNSLSDTAGSSIQYLTVHYDPKSTYQSINNFIFNGAHKIKVQILNISSSVSWNVLPALTLMSELNASPTFKFSCSTDTIHFIDLDTSTISTQGELNVFWDDVLAADQYDLEWTYIDSSALANHVYGDDPSNLNLDKIFQNNASRITTTGLSYMVPLMFDDTGSLFMRVRPVQLKSNHLIVPGKWVYTDSLKNICRFNFGGHERKLNWQSTISFAEEGKRKIVVQYFDGSLRSRQTVTKDNTTNTTVVAENMYDYQGRPVIQVMPAPTLDNIIHYAHNFNVSLNDSNYDKSLYDTLLSPANYCGHGAPPMDTVSGASQYYSPANPQKDIAYNKFIPDSKKYPFTETRYEQDNTGRIASQSGVGPDYQIGSGHETKYYYGGADQTELDALFGTEAGINTHYFKNMVCDANGQFSVSYVDMHGRTVATALAGATPPGMERLPSNISDTITEIIGSNIRDGLTLESQKSLLVSDAGEHLFHYSLSPENLKIPSCNGDSICYDCLYNLEITITDDCNNQKLPGGKPVHILKSNFSIGDIDTACNAAGFNFDTTINLPTGNYNITKKLTVSQYGMDFYRDSVFVPKNTCKNLQQFIAQQDSIFNAANDGICTPDCSTCMADLGTFDSFKARFFAGAGIVPADTAAYSDEVLAEYNDALQNCAILCEKSNDTDAVKTAMLADMSPVSSGQYADSSHYDKYNIFYATYDNAGNVTHAPAYQDTNIVYRNDIGEPDSVYDANLQQKVPPQQLDSADFVQNFQSSWEAALLPFHPEYCKLVTYETFDSSFVWDNEVENISTYADAVAQGFFDPLSDTSHNSDPLQRIGGGAYYMPLYKKLHGYYNQGSDSVSLWAFACMLVECKSTATTGTPDPGCLLFCQRNTFNPDSICTADLDVAWQMFREIYQGIKRDIIYGQLPPTCPDRNGNPITTGNLTTLHHHLNFISAADAISQNGLGSFNQGSGASDVSAAKDSLASAFDANCRAYINQWISQLAPCNYTQAAINDTIIPMLLTVCEKGADVTHPFGSSTISPDSTNIYNSFQDVLNAYNQEHGIANGYICNSELITLPLPYDQQQAYGDVEVSSKPDTCQCSVITGLYNEYQASSPSHPDSLFYQYVKNTRNTTISNSDLFALLAACDSTSKCQNLSSPITLPPALQCNVGKVCLSCSEMSTYYNSFIKTYGNDYAPSYPPEDSRDSVLMLKDQLFANYMNNRLGFNYEYTEYLRFMALCPAFNTNNADSATPSCYLLQSTLTNFKSFYQGIDFSQIYKNKKITKCAQTIINSVNLLAQAYQNSTQQVFANGYQRAPFGDQHYSHSYIKLKAITPQVNGLGTNINIPLSLDCNAIFPGTAQVERLKANHISPSDFVNPLAVTDSDAADRYIAVIASDSKYYDRLFWGRDVLDGLDYYYYGISQPYLKYINQGFYQDVQNQVFGLGLIDVPDTVVTPAQFDAYYTFDLRTNGLTSGDLAGPFPPGIDIDSIQQVYNLRFDTSVIAPGFANDGNLNPSHLEVTVKHLDGSITNEWLMDNYGTMIEYKETIDTNLYNHDCQKAFTTYFNMQNNTNYSFSTIDSIYFHTCGIHPSPCASTCDTLQSVLSNYKNTVSNYTPHYDSSGCDVTFWKLNNICGGASYADPRYRLARWMHNGILTMPEEDTALAMDSVTGTNTTFNYIDTLCAPDAFTFEARASVPVDSNHRAMYIANPASHGPHPCTVAEFEDPSAVYGNMNYNLIFDYNKSLVIWLNRKTYIDTPFVDSIFLYVDAFTDSGHTGWRNIPTGLKNLSQYHTLRGEVKNSILKVYLDGTLLFENYVPGLHISSFERLSADQYGFDLHLDWVKFYDTTNAVRYFEDFNGCENTDKQTLPHKCPEQCQEDFVNYYNSIFGTSYNYSNVDSVYYNSCGIHPVPCPTNSNNGNGDSGGPWLCGKSIPVFPVMPVPVINSCSDSTSFSLTTGTDLYNAYNDSLANYFDSVYRKKCLNAFNFETFTVKHAIEEYHYTLYYYDQAGNLVKTVPPKGVVLQRRQSWYDSVDAARNNNISLPNPSTSLFTQYRYNTLNQVIAQKSPDGGESHFWYDRLGRLCISQNAKQSAFNHYSYTLYDSIGRITEVGEITSATAMDDSISRKPDRLDAWITAAESTKAQITQTVYDIAYSPIGDAAAAGILQPENLRNRIAYTMFYDTAADMHPGGQAAASYYSYDIEGNVDTLIQDYNHGVMQTSQNRFKKLVYDYDLVSGKVNNVAYQPNQPDAFYHTYLYDAENRITDVFTSHDSLNWDREALYEYYKHGLLARAVIGQQQVQGLDYLYTLQGWLKAVNPTTLKLGDSSSNGCSSGTAINTLEVNTRLAPNPPSYIAHRSIIFEDGFISNASDSFVAYIDTSLAICTAVQPSNDPDEDSSSFVAKDAYHFVLNYNNNDYTPIGTGILSPSILIASQLGADTMPLFNGNISSMAVNIESLNQPMLYNYRYDQLNRLVGMDAWKSNSTWSSLTKVCDYKERVSYDANGNILTYFRNGTTAGGKPLAMDSLKYSYMPGTNQLDHVHDSVPPGNYSVDIDGQDTLNYSYDSIGNMISDAKDSIHLITWTVYGKIDSIYKNSSVPVSIKYTYDVTGNRISKKVIRDGHTTITNYVRDAAGNVMSVYTSTDTVKTGDLVQDEVDMYGSSRLGLWKAGVDMSHLPDTVWVSLPGLGGNGYLVNFTRGNKLFELTNHLGNVLVTVSDKKLQVQNPLNTDSVLSYTADVINANDYYPFGMVMPGRDTSAGSGYRYGFNGQEKSTEIGLNTNTAEFWEYDARLGRRWNVDPKQTTGISDYSCFMESPVWFTDALGDSEYESAEAFAKTHQGKTWDKDKGKGDWLTSDRTGNSDIWKTANNYNLQQENGYKEYTSIEQRADFYKWFQGAANTKGSEIKWAGAASEVAKGINMLTWKTPKFLGYSSDEAVEFAETGNRMIFQDVFPKLRNLYNGTPLKGNDAYNWDAMALSQEQNLIQPLYESTPAIGLLSAAAKQLLVFSSWVAPVKAFPKNGNLSNVSERWVYGMQNMGYTVQLSNMPDPGVAYKSFMDYGAQYRPIFYKYIYSSQFQLLKGNWKWEVK